MTGFISQQLLIRSAQISAIANNGFHRMLFAGELQSQIFDRYLIHDYYHMKATGSFWLYLSEAAVQENKDLFKQRAEKDFQNAEKIKGKYLSNPSLLRSYQESLEDKRYINFLNRMQGHRTAYLLSALMPCYVLYREIPKFYDSYCLLSKNPYKDWIKDQYKQVESKGTVRKLVQVLDAMATQSSPEELEIMSLVFNFSLRHEETFFNRAYDQKISYETHSKAKENSSDTFVSRLEESRVELQETQKSL